MYTIEKLKAKDYDDLLLFLDTAFGYNEQNGFLMQLPAMWERTDAVMEHNIAIKDGTKIVAAAGVYPLNVHIGEQNLLFVTTGNIAVAKEYRGQGLFRMLMLAIDEEIKRLNADVARLGGGRQRYGRYGYEYAGKTYAITYVPKNMLNFRHNKIYFKEINHNDGIILEKIRALQEKQFIFAERGSAERFHKVMRAWGNVPYVAEDAQGNFIGALAASMNKRSIAEFYADTPQTEAEMLCSWLSRNQLNDCSVEIPEYKKQLLKIFSAICEYQTVKYATQIRVLHFDRLADALISLKRTVDSEYAKINGEIIIEIDGRVKVKINSSGAMLTDQSADISVDSVTATRLLFGYQSADEIIDLPRGKEMLIKELLPLPFWWNGLDRV